MQYLRRDKKAAIYQTHILAGYMAAAVGPPGPQNLFNNTSSVSCAPVMMAKCMGGGNSSSSTPNPPPVPRRPRNMSSQSTSSDDRGAMEQHFPCSPFSNSVDHRTPLVAPTPARRWPTPQYSLLLNKLTCSSSFTHHLSQTPNNTLHASTNAFHDESKLCFLTNYIASLSQLLICLLINTLHSEK